ncbi:MAG: glycosyltransferase [Anaerolineae bacterium]|nr:glycosyltransferase [Anaerolineae bacterium]
MDILLITALPVYPRHSRDAMLVAYLARELAARRHVLDLLSFYHHPEELAEQPRYRHYFRSVKLVRDVPRRLKERHLERAQRFPQEESAAWSREMWQAVLGCVQDAHYDVVQLVGGVEVYEYWHLMQGLPTVIIPSARHFHYLTPPAQARHLPGEDEPFRASENWMFAPFDRVLITTPQEGALMSKMDALARQRRIPLGVDTDYFTPTGYDPIVPGLLFSGDFALQADLEAALLLCEEVLPRVQATLPETRLYLLGRNAPPHLLEHASERVIIAQNIIDPRPYFERASVYLCPLTSYGGFRLDILQALAMQTPVIASDESLAGLDIHSGQEVLVRRFAEDFAETAVDLIRDEELRRRLKTYGQACLKNQYLWERVADLYETLYLDLIG